MQNSGRASGHPRRHRRGLLVTAAFVVMVTGMTGVVEAATAHLRLSKQGSVVVVSGSGFSGGTAGQVTASSKEPGWRQIQRVSTDKAGQFQAAFDFAGAAPDYVRTAASVGSSPLVAVDTDAPLASVPVPAPVPAPAAGYPTLVGPHVGYGPKAGYTPSYDVLLRPGKAEGRWQTSTNRGASWSGDVTPQSIVTAHPAGTRFGFQPGVYRIVNNEPIRPQAGQEFLGFDGAAIRGSRVLGAWTKSGSRWYATGQTQQFPVVSETHASLGLKYCRDNAPMCRFTEQVFLNGKALTQVPTLDRLTTGTFYFDYTADRIYLGDDPTGRLVEASVTQLAFQGTGGRSNVTLRNLVIEQFATPTQTPAMIDSQGGSGWKVLDSTIRHSASVGLSLRGGSWVARGNKIVDNGQMGMKGFGAGGVVDGNELGRNNSEGYRQGFESGATKFVQVNNVQLVRNWVHNNLGNGLWADIDNYGAVYEHNVVEANEYKGIFHEISFDAKIRNNLVRGNGWGSPYWFDGAGINVGNSSNVEVYGNTLEGNLSGITARYDSRTKWDMKNLYVHDNTIDHPGVANRVGTRGFAAGVASFEGSTSTVFTTKNNRYQNNTYILRGDTNRSHAWRQTNTNFTGWRNHGHDKTGTMTTK